MLKENKANKYILYAIGEILLVVVGILLALQINQWNQNRINRNLEVKYSENLLADLLKDQQSLESALQRLNTSASNAESLISQLNKSIPFSDSLLLAMLRTQINIYPFYPSKTTINEIYNNSNLNLFRDESIRTDISKHYDRVSYRLDNLKAVEPLTLERIGEIFPTGNSISNEYYSYIAQNVYEIDIKPKDPEYHLSNSPVFNASINQPTQDLVYGGLLARRVLLNYTERYLQDLLKSTQNLIDKLKKYNEGL
ncbi:MAG: hypothetical protein HKM26_06925 [Winogradskyella sp.]|nr:hypothetical protein [Winogradskyella sp.]